MSTPSAPTAEELVRRLSLVPHPEGGFFRETHRDALLLTTLPESRFVGARSASTAIYYLLRRGDFSAFHRIASDEVWHHYLGATLTVHVLDRGGSHRVHRVGVDFESGASPQAVVPAGAWFGARLEDDGDYALVGCTVAPGFEFADFEMASREALLEAFPEHRDLVLGLTRT